MISQTEYDESEQMLAGSMPRTMGTRLEALLCGAARDEALGAWEKMCLRADELSACLDRFSPMSDVSRFNSGTLASPSGDLLALMNCAGEWKELTGGLFDASYGGTLDFGGIAKGWFLEETKTILTLCGISCAYVNFGSSSILTIGEHPSGGPWKISLPHPAEGREMDLFSLHDCSLSISGNTPRYHGHIINPRTSQPVLGHIMTSVQGPSPLSCEVLSTTAMVASPEEREELRAKFPDYIIKFYGQ